MYNLVNLIVSNGTDIYHLFCVDPGYANLVRDIGRMENPEPVLTKIESLLCDAMDNNKDLRMMLSTDYIRKMVG